MSELVYEIVDNVYDTVGIFDTLETSKNALLSLKSPIGDDCGLDCYVYEIRERQLNELKWSETCKVIARFNLIEVYDEKKDENYWRLEECNV